MIPIWQSEATRILARDSGLLPDEAVARLDAFAPIAMTPQEPRPHLTKREREILASLAEGKSRSDIAEALFVSPNTVKTQTSSLYAKLSASSRDEAVAAGLRWNYL